MRAGRKVKEEDREDRKDISLRHLQEENDKIKDRQEHIRSKWTRAGGQI